MQQQKGSCGCGLVEFTLNAKALNVINCHCNMCRNHNGTAFSSYAIFPADCLEITAGQEAIVKYLAGDAEKHFCKTCGTPLFNAHKNYSSVRMIYLGSLHSIDDITPKLNVWCENKLDWVDTLANDINLPQGSQ